MSTRLIINPSAGAGRAYRHVQRRTERLHAIWPGLETIVSRSASHVTELAAQAAARGYERVLIAGGDGTAHFAANGLVHTETALGIIPVGTGNDVAQSVGVPKRSIDAALDVLAQDHVRQIDLGQIGDRVFCCVLGVGMDTMALETINASRIRRGRLLYSYATLKTIFRYEPQNMRLEYDDEFFEGPIMFAAITNTRSYAGGFHISPAAEVDDGELDVCVFPQMNYARMLRAFGAVFDGSHAHLADIVTARAKRAHFRCDVPLPVTLDGEVTALTTELFIRVLAGALRVLGAPDTARVCPAQLAEQCAA